MKASCLHRLTFTSALLFCTTGCLRLGPKRPAAMRSADLIFAPGTSTTGTPVTKDQLAVLVGEYHKVVNSPTANLDLAKTYRNQIIFGMMSNIEYIYNDFEGSLLAKRALAQTGEDAAQLGATAAIAVVGAPDIKDLLAASAVALHGTRLSFDKNFFQERTTSAILSQMRASRADVQAQIIKRSADTVSGYSLEEAWKDLQRYFNAGTIQSALIQIDASAGEAAKTAQANVAQAIADVTPPTTLELSNARKAGLIRSRLQVAVNSSDPNMKEAADAVIRNAIKALQVQVSPSDDTAQLFDKLMAYVDGRQLSRAQTNAYTSALLTAPASLGGNQ